MAVFQKKQEKEKPSSTTTTEPIYKVVKDENNYKIVVLKETGSVVSVYKKVD